MSRIDLLNALRVVKDYCLETDCEQCAIKDICEYDLELSPMLWKLDEE